MRDWVIPVSGHQAGKRPAPLIAGHNYLIKADRTTAQTPWRQPFFLPPNNIVGRMHKHFPNPTRQRSYTDLTILARTHLSNTRQIPAVSRCALSMPAPRTLRQFSATSAI